jgi:hypothetical protein
MRLEILFVSGLLFAGLAHSAGFQDENSTIEAKKAERKSGLEVDIGKRFFVYPSKTLMCPVIKDEPKLFGAKNYVGDDGYSFVVDSVVQENQSDTLFYKVTIDDGSAAYIWVSGGPLSLGMRGIPLDAGCLSTFSPTEIEAAQKKEAAKAIALKSKHGVRIGMTAKQVREQSNWGEPKSVNRTIAGNITHEQWVYGNGNYLYFSDGKLTSIQN